MKRTIGHTSTPRARATVTAIALALTSTAQANKPIKPSQELMEFATEIHWIDNVNELQKIRAKYGQQRPGSIRDGASIGMLLTEKGFTVLTRNTATNKYTCRLYVLRPRTVDDDLTRSLGHELLHCIVGNYH